MSVYEQLRERLDAHPTTAPKTETIDKILRILFTPEEAGIAIHMNYKSKNVEAIAKSAGISEDIAKKHLESMANKGIIFSRRKDGNVSYGLVPLILGIFEFPFMKGKTTPMHKKLGQLWEEYHHEALGSSFSGNPTPLMRVVAMEKSIPAQDRIHPYEEVKNFINSANYIA